MPEIFWRVSGCRAARVGCPDQFIEHGAVDILRKKHGLTAEAAVEKILPLLKAKKAGTAKSVA